MNIWNQRGSNKCPFSRSFAIFQESLKKITVQLLLWYFQVDPKLKKQVRVISGPKARKPVSEAKPWGYTNNGGKKFTVQSKRDPNYEAQQDIKEERKQARTELQVNCR